MLVYFGFIFLFGLVGLSGEFAFGRLTGTGPIGSYDYALKSRGKKGGSFLGAIPLIGSLGIAIGYAVIVGWILRYLWGALSGVIMKEETTEFFSQANRTLWKCSVASYRDFINDGSTGRRCFKGD